VYVLSIWLVICLNLVNLLYIIFFFEVWTIKLKLTKCVDRSVCAAELLNSPPITQDGLGSIPRVKFDSGFRPSKVGKMSSN